MGTRSLTFVYEKYGQVQKPVVNMYRQFDGYPTGHGAELAEFLSEGKMVNGLRFNEEGKFFNGAGCLAAQLVAHFKKESGGFYLHPTSVEDCGQDYEYHIYTDGEQHLRIKVMDCGCNMFGMTQDETYDPLFEGNLQEFAEFCKVKEEA